MPTAQRHLAATLVAAVCFCSTNTFASPNSVRARQVADRMLASLLEANGVPGMGAAVVVDGVVSWRGSAGMRDVDAQRAVDRHTVFRLASVSKLLTATAAAKLHEEGRLDLDAPVQSVLPWLKAPWQPVSARQLAAHTAGLPHYQDIDLQRGTTRYSTVRSAVGIFENRAAVDSPGNAYRYSSWGYTLLSAMVEAGAGEPFLDYLKHAVTPGLAISADITDSNDPAVSHAYGFDEGRAVRLPPHDFSYSWGGGGLAATPEAIALFGSRVLDGSLVSRATFDSMLTPALLVDGSAAGERDYTVGLGWRSGRDADGEPIAHHAGVADGARSALVVWPVRRASASVLSNALWTSSIERTAEMLAAPFLKPPGTSSPLTRRCPVDAAAYDAEFDGQPFHGVATFSSRDSLCSGRISLADGPLRAWLNDFPQRDADALEIIGLHHGAGLSRAALVTPIGLHDLRVGVDGQSMRVQFGPTRTLVIRLRKKDTANATTSIGVQTSPSVNQPAPVPRWNTWSLPSTSPAGIESSAPSRS